MRGVSPLAPGPVLAHSMMAADLIAILEWSRNARQDLTRGLSADGTDRTAGEVMHRTFETVDGPEPLDAVFGRLSQEPDKTLLVTDHEQLVGLVGLDEITNLMRLRRAITGRQAHVASVESPTAMRTGTHR